MMLRFLIVLGFTQACLCVTSDSITKFSKSCTPTQRIWESTVLSVWDVVPNDCVLLVGSVTTCTTPLAHVANTTVDNTTLLWDVCLCHCAKSCLDSLLIGDDYCQFVQKSSSQFDLQTYAIVVSIVVVTFPVAFVLYSSYQRMRQGRESDHIKLRNERVHVLTKLIRLNTTTASSSLSHSDRNSVSRVTSPPLSPSVSPSVIDDHVISRLVREGSRRPRRESVTSETAATVAAKRQIHHAKQVVFVFTDIEDSTRMSAHDSVGYRFVQELHDSIMRQAIADCNGFEIRTQGDAFEVAFFTVTDACLFCLMVQESLLNTSWPSSVLSLPACGVVSCPHTHVPLFAGPRVRMGIHFAESREAFSTSIHQGAHVFQGAAVDLVRMVSDCAFGGQIVVTEPVATRLLLGGPSYDSHHSEMQHKGPIAPEVVRTGYPILEHLGGYSFQMGQSSSASSVVHLYQLHPPLTSMMERRVFGGVRELFRAAPRRGLNVFLPSFTVPAPQPQSATDALSIPAHIKSNLIQTPKFTETWGHFEDDGGVAVVCVRFAANFGPVHNNGGPISASMQQILNNTSSSNNPTQRHNTGSLETPSFMSSSSSTASVASATSALPRATKRIGMDTILSVAQMFRGYVPVQHPAVIPPPNVTTRHSLGAQRLLRMRPSMVLRSRSVTRFSRAVQNTHPLQTQPEEHTRHKSMATHITRRLTGAHHALFSSTQAEPPHLASLEDDFVSASQPNINPASQSDVEGSRASNSPTTHGVEVIHIVFPCCYDALRFALVSQVALMYAPWQVRDLALWGRSEKTHTHIYRGPRVAISITKLSAQDVLIVDPQLRNPRPPVSAMARKRKYRTQNFADEPPVASGTPNASAVRALGFRISRNMGFLSKTRSLKSSAEQLKPLSPNFGNPRANNRSNNNSSSNSNNNAGTKAAAAANAYVVTDDDPLPTFSSPSAVRSPPSTTAYGGGSRPAVLSQHATTLAEDAPIFEDALLEPIEQRFNLHEQQGMLQQQPVAASGVRSERATPSVAQPRVAQCEEAPTGLDTSVSPPTPVFVKPAVKRRTAAPALRALIQRISTNFAPTPASGQSGSQNTQNVQPPQHAERRELRFVGTAVEDARVLCTLAHAGQILLSESAWESVSDRLPPQTLVTHLGVHKVPRSRNPPFPGSSQVHNLSNASNSSAVNILAEGTNDKSPVTMSLVEVMPMVLAPRVFPPVPSAMCLARGARESPDPTLSQGPTFRRGSKHKRDNIGGGSGGGGVAIVFCKVGDTVESIGTFQDRERVFAESLVLWAQLCRFLLPKFDGYECKEPEPGKFTLAFQDPWSAIAFCCSAQLALLDLEWPVQLEESAKGTESARLSAATIANDQITDEDLQKPMNQLLWRGLRIRMGMAFGRHMFRKTLQSTGHADYFGMTPNLAARVLGQAAPGQFLFDSAHITNNENAFPDFSKWLRAQQSHTHLTSSLHLSGSAESLVNTTRSIRLPGVSEPVVVSVVGSCKLKGIETERLLLTASAVSLAERQFPPPAALVSGTPKPLPKAILVQSPKSMLRNWGFKRKQNKDRAKSLNDDSADGSESETRRRSMSWHE